MRVGVFTPLLSQLPLAAVLKKLAALQINTVELATGNYPGDAHCKLSMLEDAAAVAEFKKVLADHGVTISALSCHGNALHPDKARAKQDREVSRKTILLAEKLGIPVMVDFSGCPGDSPHATAPNWVTCPWPPDYLKVLDWQWSEVGCNFDPSHLFWQSIDPIAAVRVLAGAIFHVHAKDTQIYSANLPRTGVLDTKPYTDERNRSWIFRTCGYGHGAEWWSELISTLRMFGYDHVLSIEHEDSLLSPEEGLTKAANFLNSIVIRERPTAAWWA
jgi:sugar phosphate isomerase/epimerase